MKKSLLLLCMISGLAVLSFAQKTWNGGAGTNNWGDANNWNPIGVPTASDAVTIGASFTVNLNVAGNAQSLTVNGTLNITTSPFNLTIADAGFVTVNSGGRINFNAANQILGGSTGANGIQITIQSGANLSTQHASGFTTSALNNVLLTGSFAVNKGNKTPVYSTLANYSFIGVGAQNSGNAMAGANNLTIGGFGAKTLGNPGLTVTGTLSLQGLIPSLTNAVTFGPAGTLEYASSSPITTTDNEFPGGSGPLNLRINNPNGVILHSSRTVSGTLFLVNGILNTQGNFLILSNTTPFSQINGGSASSYVYSSGTGRLYRFNLPGGIGNLFDFPVGTASHYLPVTINPKTITSTFAVNVYEGVTMNGVEGGTPVPNKSNIVDACWNIDRPAGSGTASVKFNWNNALEGTTFSNFSDAQIKIAKYTGSIWTQFGAAGAGNVSASQTLNFAQEDFTSFSPFIVGGGSILTTLPVAFGPFKAYEKLNGIQLDWKVYSEDKVTTYVIERSTDARTFNSIGIQSAIYNNSIGGEYGFFDANPLPGISYYRLKNVDIDGKSSYSPIISVNLNKNVKGLKLYPNPVVNSLLVLQGSNLEKGLFTLKLKNINGQEILQQFINHSGGSITQTIELPFSAGKGMYVVLVYDAQGNIIMNEKMIKL